MRQHDLFLTLRFSEFVDVVSLVEREVSSRVASRHKYPIWPDHNFPLDSYEQALHKQIRQPYYGMTIILIQVLRRLREIA